MMRDLLLQANTHPDPTPDWAIERSARLAASLDAKLSFAICQVHIPQVSNWLANRLVALDSVIADENRKSTANQEALSERFATLVPDAQRGDSIVIACRSVVTPWQLAVSARAHDLTIVPYYGHAETVSVAEGLIFESGRPALLLPEPTNVERGLGKIAIAWDGSRAAARALADAMPLCRSAESVTVVQINGDKDLTNAAPLAEAVRHLSLHEIPAQPVELELSAGDAAATLQSYCTDSGCDLLVMGAFGQSRAREFVLGGATRSVLGGPKLPILISH